MHKACGILALALALVSCGKKDSKPTSSSVPEKAVEKIEINGAKTEFAYNEDFSFGGEVVATYEDETTKVIESGYSVDSSAFQKGKQGNYTITVTYKGQSCAYKVSVLEAPIVSIKLSGMRTEFNWGDGFIFDGVVEGTDVNGDTRLIDDYHYVVDYEDYDNQVAGTYTIIVSLVDYATVTSSYEVTVGEKGENGVRIAEYKQTYSVLEDFSLSDVTGYYVALDGTEEPITAENTIIDLGSYKECSLGTFDITISHVDNQELTKTITIKVIKPNTIRILFIGNSFSDDTAEHIPDILKNLGYENFEIGNLVIGGCEINTHYFNAVYNYANYEFRYHNGETWDRKVGRRNQTFAFGVEYSEWDVVSLQQVSGYSGLPETYDKLDDLADEVKKLAKNPSVKIVFNMTWAYQQGSNHSNFYNYNRDQMTMYNAITSTVQSNVKYTVMPSGTAIQNARTSFIGDTLTRDGYHLHEYLGRYIASLAFVSKLLNEDLSTLTWKPYGVTEEQKLVAIESALNAVKTPFSVTESKYKAE